MKPKSWLLLASLTALLAACGGKQEASKRNFKEAIDSFANQERVCLPVGLNHDTGADNDVPAGGLLGDKHIRIPLKNGQGDRINKNAMRQLDVLTDAGFYRRGDDSQQTAGSGNSVPVAVFERTEQGDGQVLPSPHGSLLCLGTQQVEDIVLFTEPTAANGVTVSKVVYEARLAPEKWVSKLLKYSDPELKTRLDEPQRQNITLVITNAGWRDLRELR